MYRLITAVFAIVLLTGCGATEEVADDIGINGGEDDPVVTTQQQQVAANDAVPGGNDPECAPSGKYQSGEHQ